MNEETKSNAFASPETKTYWDILDKLLNVEMRVSPRGQDTSEIIGYSGEFCMLDPEIRCATRKLHKPFLYAEPAWMLGGRADVDWIKPYNRHLARFSDNGLDFFGAYGPKIMGQMEYVISKLCTDPSSRQAVVNIWRENPPKTKDVPCTLSLQFIIRNARLHCISTMRSNDIWLGLPYDIFSFSAIAHYVTKRLNEHFGIHALPIIVGTLHHRVGSLHLYAENRAAATEAVQKRKVRGHFENRFSMYQTCDSHRFITLLRDAANHELSIIAQK